ncbi:MAG: isocitrate dehydrogenase (NADP(+)) [Deltaproteobacteria bacterium]|nr:isocitrate dehydrogenase (NADP(+)) [Deltaproteobacteria bacterium]MBW2071052.1 isocitrate dehydrogenase (NADP(+)) [Deltaproteobacteria bacterium]
MTDDVKAREDELVTLKEDGSLSVPDRPIIVFIQGDGIGPDIWNAAVRVFDAAVAGVYGEKRRVQWLEALAGEKAFAEKGEWLPGETLELLRKHVVGIKGPLTTPVGGGIRSLNVTLRQVLDLYACIRPVRYYRGVPAPVRHPEKVDMVVFRENTEDVYAGIEWPAESPEARRIVAFIDEHLSKKIRPDSAIGIKPMSRRASQRLVRRAIRYALDNDRRSVTLVHKGNIMKYTEGAFRQWGYELAAEEFPQQTVAESEVQEKYGGVVPEGRLLIKDRIADMMFQQALLRPEEYEVLAMPNLNGDYLSDALAAQVGGLGMAPGANVGDEVAVFEATHGTAPKYAGQDKVNPSSLILSGAMMFEYLGWQPVAERIRQGLESSMAAGIVTYDLARQMSGAQEVKCSEFASAVIEKMAAL